MPDWFLNPALTRFRNEVNARWPRRDKTSDGTIGDAAHAARSSDHNPDSDGSVDAWDMDVDGVDVEACKRAFEAHEASGYWIHNDQIAFRDEGWRPRSYAYAGPNRNRHTKHVHFNTRQSHERSTKPWFTQQNPPEDDMAWDEARIARLEQLVLATNERVEGIYHNKDSVKATWSAKDPDADDVNEHKKALAAAAGGVDEDVIADAIAAAIPTELADQVIDKLVARLAS